MIPTPYWIAISTSVLLMASKRSVFFSLTWHEKLQKGNSWIQSRNADKLLKLWTDKLSTEFFQCKSFQGRKYDKIKKLKKKKKVSYWCNHPQSPWST